MLQSMISMTEITGESCDDHNGLEDYMTLSHETNNPFHRGKAKIAITPDTTFSRKFTDFPQTNSTMTTHSASNY